MIAIAQSPRTERDVISFVLLTESAVIALGFAALANEHSDMLFVGSARPGQAQEMLAASRPDVAIIDHNGATTRVVTDLCETIGRRWPSVAILVVSDVVDESTVRTLLEAGARGYVCKSADSSALVTAIRQLADGNAVLDPQVTRTVIDWARFGGADTANEELSQREIDVLRLVSHGEPNKRIATRLGLTENTVKTYLRRAYKKLDCNTRSAAAAALAQRGLI